jgi:hypothetical protein
MSFSPTSISGLYIWLDANDSTTITRSGTTLTAWQSKGIRTGSFTPTSGTPQTNTTRTIFGKNVVYFPSNSEMRYTTSLPFQDRTFYCVFKSVKQLLQSPAEPRVLSFFNNYDTGGQRTEVNTTTTAGQYTFRMCRIGDATCGLNGRTTFNFLNQPCCIGLGQTSNSTQTSSNFARLNGSNLDIRAPTLAASNFGTGSLQWRLNDNGNEGSQEMAELLVYGRLLSPTEQTQVENYLMVKWGIPSQSISVSSTTSYLSVNSQSNIYPTSYKQIQLPVIDTPTVGRMIYVKDIMSTPNLSSYFASIAADTGNLIDSRSSISVSTLTAVTLQANTNAWNIHNIYNGYAVFSTNATIDVGAAVVQAPVDRSLLMVDLQAQSKVVVLPSLSQTAPLSSPSLFLTLKDVYGFAAARPMYLSTTAGNTIDGRITTLKLTTNFASIDLLANLSNNQWNIVNFYAGNLVTR